MLFFTCKRSHRLIISPAADDRTDFTRRQWTEGWIFGGEAFSRKTKLLEISPPTNFSPFRISKGRVLVEQVQRIPRERVSRHYPKYWEFWESWDEIGDDYQNAWESLGGIGFELRFEERSLEIFDPLTPAGVNRGCSLLVKPTPTSYHLLLSIVCRNISPG